MSEKKTSYFNTMVFTIISAIVSLLLLLALFFDFFKNYMTFIITIEVGIFIIIGFCIYQIFANESKFDKHKSAANVNIKFTECPDYYVRKTIIQNSKPVDLCSNEYTVQDKFKNKYIMKIYPADNPAANETYALPSQHDINFTTSTPVVDKYRMNVFDSALDLPSMAKKCGAVLGQETAYKTYSKLPLTGLSARCENIVR